MQTATQIVISEAEWEIMRVVWAHGEVTSREVIGFLQDKMNWKESTVKTLIGRLVEKEALLTRKEGRKFIYSPGITERETIHQYSSGILDRVCAKHNKSVLAQLIDEAVLSQSDITELMDQLQDKMISAPIEVPCQCPPGQCVCHLNAF